MKRFIIVSNGRSLRFTGILKAGITLVRLIYGARVVALVATIQALAILIESSVELMIRFQSRALKATLTLSFPQRKAHAPLVLFAYQDKDKR